MALNFLQNSLGDIQRMADLESMGFPAERPALGISDMGSNFLQTLSGGGLNAAPKLTPHQPNIKVPREPRERRSALDTIGRIADVLARVGGAEALYQPTLDAREDRTRQVDLDALRKTLLEQQVAAGGQAPQESMRARMGQALGAVSRAENPAAIWSQIDPAMVGIDQQTYQAIGQRLEANPQSAGILAGMFGYTEPKTASLPSEIQNYGMYQKILAEQGPEAASQFMRFVEPSAQITPYQQAQIQRDDRRLTLDERRAAATARAAEQRLKLQEQRDATKAAGGDLTPTQRGVVTQKLQMLPVIKQQLQRVADLQAEMADRGTLARGRVGGLLPGAVAGGKAEQFDKALGSLRKSILSLTRTPGIGSMSNYETRLDEMGLPSRWGSDAGRAEAIQGVRELILGLEAGYKEMVPTTARNVGGGPRPGTVQQGYRFKGGNPADKNNWVKVQ